METTCGGWDVTKQREKKRDGKEKIENAYLWAKGKTEGADRRKCCSCLRWGVPKINRGKAKGEEGSRHIQRGKGDTLKGGGQGSVIWREGKRRGRDL